MTTYKIGDTGPSGGVVFIVSEDGLYGVEAQREDQPDYMSWDDAIIQNTGNWRLPTKDELNELFRHKDDVGGFASDSYWSSSDGGPNSAWIQYFNLGDQYNYDKNFTFPVRLVKEF